MLGWVDVPHTPSFACTKTRKCKLRIFDISVTKKINKNPFSFDPKENLWFSVKKVVKIIETHRN
jgi:hypothetical protein